MEDYDVELMKDLAMSDIGLTEDEAELAVEEFISDNQNKTWKHSKSTII